MTVKKPSIETVLETVTPEIAAEYLTHNTSNRRMRQQWVDYLARAIEDGDWFVTHQGIAFNCDGTLQDGQHRLLAIIKAGKPVQMMVTRGLPSEAMQAVDNGARRTDADAFKLLGFDFDNDSVAIARAMVMGNDASQSSRITRPSLLRFMEEHLDALQFARRWAKHRGFSRAGILAVVARAWYTADRVRLAEFMDCLIGGVNHGSGDLAAISFRNLVLREGDSFTSGSRRIVLYRKAEVALAAFLKHRSLSRICEASEELFPLPEEGTR